MASLLWSCFFTIFIDTWNAVHMNTHLPDDRDPDITIFFRKLGWIVFAMIAPEPVCWMALNKYMYSRQILKQLKAISSRDTEWTFVHGHFIAMGAFVILLDDKPNPIRLDPPKLMVKNRIIPTPTFTKSDTEDKSKSNWFTKAIS
ncbi:hypothetical protein K432DRAFT_464814 [Lepidopterella palustris CBS 459.81]|uniref:Uncharacterized protein n=1 Tax=Lepidopterella palustris CBS 459.81 TaxID=1314670 RepID=A0A8E2E1W0_9PEZI|nr:hypothetical protein K432DRAFT_464814 [Lepidopterella palustris CBS 459.81]